MLTPLRKIIFVIKKNRLKLTTKILALKRRSLRLNKPH